MNVLCLVSSQPGHLDFGGMGYKRVAEAMRARGHTVTWATAGAQTQRLQSAEFSVTEFEGVDDLSMWFVDRSIQTNALPRSVLQVLVNLRELVSRGVDVVLCDRVLGLAALALAQTGTPYCAMGTPGGIWIQDTTGVRPEQTPPWSYNAIGEAIKRMLGWHAGNLSSFWVNSPYLNVAFLGRNFYPDYSIQREATVLVRHYGESVRAARDRIGLSFGNSGKPEALISVLGSLVERIEINVGLDVFVGNRDTLYEELSQTTRDSRVRVHRWVNFGEFFPHLHYLIFFGGVGTIWECICHSVPMAIIPDTIGDQRFNALSVQALGMGTLLSPLVENGDAILKRLEVFERPDAFQSAIENFRAHRNYTDTIESLCNRIESLAKSGG